MGPLGAVEIRLNLQTDSQSESNVMGPSQNEVHKMKPDIKLCLQSYMLPVVVYSVISVCASVLQQWTCM